MSNNSLWGWIQRKIRPLFWPDERPNHDNIKAMVRQCPMPWPDFTAVCNKRHFIWRFAYWVRYNRTGLSKDDVDTMHAYWQLIQDSNDPAFWRLAGFHGLRVHTILRCLLTDKKLPTPG